MLRSKYKEMKCMGGGELKKGMIHNLIKFFMLSLATPRNEKKTMN